MEFYIWYFLSADSANREIEPLVIVYDYEILS